LAPKLPSQAFFFQSFFGQAHRGGALNKRELILSRDGARSSFLAGMERLSIG
jgi:hypothetical protein